jgi:hypothetical protein
LLDVPACSCEIRIRRVIFIPMSEGVIHPGTEDARGKRRFRYFSEGPIEDLGPVDAGRGERADEQATTAGHSDHFQVSADMRVMVEKSVEQARQAFDGFIGAAQRAVDMFGETAGKGAKDIAEKAVTFAEKDMALSFEFARQLVRARGVQDVLKLHTEYINAQMQLFSEHTRSDPTRAEK